MTFTPVLERQKHMDLYELQANLLYVSSFRPYRAIHKKQKSSSTSISVFQIVVQQNFFLLQ